MTTDNPVRTAEYHTAGEPFRIVTSGVATPEGATVPDRRQWAEANLDETRAFLVNEPRGHADMYGAFVTPADDDDGDLGVVFFHKDGFSTACGHGTIALVTWAIDSGRLGPARPSSTVEVVVDVPSGRLRTEARLDETGAVTQVRFWNVPSFVSAPAVVVETARGRVEVAVSFGGAYYGSVALEPLGLDVGAGHLDDLIRLGREIKERFAPGSPNEATVTHPIDDRLSGLYGVIFHREVGTRPLHQRNVTVFADGEVDRSPCGSGTSARLAVLHHQGRLALGENFRNEGVTGEVFDARIEGAVDEGGLDAVITSVAGAAYKTGESLFTRDPRDPLRGGFLLR